jgi:hypothetical protein
MPSPNQLQLVSKAELISNLYSDSVDDENILTDFNAGLYAKIPVKSFSIQPEIYYTTKGAEQTYNNAFV